MRIQHTLAKNVRRYRKEAGLSQWELVEKIELLADDLGVDQAYISHLENGRKNPTLTTIWFIAQALGTTADQLIKENDEIHTQK